MEPSTGVIAMNEKVAVVGAGNVGSATAQRLAEKQLADVVLIDVIGGLARGKALDLAQASTLERHDFEVSGSHDLHDVEGARIVIVTAGLPRTPGLSRDDLLEANAKAVKEASVAIRTWASEAIVIVVTNPLDAMCHVVSRHSGLPRPQVVGMAGMLDSARFRYLVARELDVSVESTFALVLGGHGDTMVPLPRFTTVAGVPVTELLPSERIDQLVERTRYGGSEIVGLLEKGGAHYAPASACAEMVASILRDKKMILPCSAYLEGEYGIDGLFVGVPIKLGRSGVEQVLELKLTEDELQALRRSADSVKTLLERLAQLGF